MQYAFAGADTVTERSDALSLSKFRSAVPMCHVIAREARPKQSGLLRYARNDGIEMLKFQHIIGRFEADFGILYFCDLQCV